MLVEAWRKTVTLGPRGSSVQDQLPDPGLVSDHLPDTGQNLN